ncbi:DNA polymerase Y family protein [Natranaerobius thermophilus]|uniref:DNA polymerase IV n=1 Tax=Natranaerobius thermophilus (strain ATCC BAA-1301 / DSM 18059 / JW/NM-WN-LF) TaxID=457570 RepID=B2A4V8_NATTJ|nr:DNA polymerase IV [Natranaerobius thermophilus]ACB83880.1 DNA-directed DNA polymerase [Natranaerobius thermophilus JW/NM-WN-LF]
MSDPIIFHIDVNSAYLSWEAAYRLQKGAQLDLRQVPSVVGGDSQKRRGIVLAKSIPAKSKFKIQTGELLSSARKKCPDLFVVPPNYDLYLRCSNAMVELLYEYSPFIQRYSVDEVFLDFTNMEKQFGDYLTAANTIKARVKEELGFTVNIGIGPNKLLAKLASEFKKPDRVHTLFPEEIPTKLWPLPVGELFMVGRATEKKLLDRGITTIGELAKTPRNKLKLWLKSHGLLIWDFANGIEESSVRPEGFPMKGLGNSTTTPENVADKETARLWLLSLTEKVSSRLRDAHCYAQVVNLSIKTSQFISYGKQKKLLNPTNSTKVIFETGKKLLNELWDEEEPLRHIGISLSSLSSSKSYQLSMFDKLSIDTDSEESFYKAIDKIRAKHGETSLIRSCFLHSTVPPLAGGVDAEEEYPMMSSLL